MLVSGEPETTVAMVPSTVNTGSVQFPSSQTCVIWLPHSAETYTTIRYNMLYAGRWNVTTIQTDAVSA